MKSLLLKGIVFLIMLVGLPWIGILITGLPVKRYLEFPPETRFIRHTPFSWAIFAAFSIVILSVILPLLIHAVRMLRRYGSGRSLKRPFPWWGWAGLCSVLFWWVLAWSRFSWFAVWQAHTFVPLWLSFILVINAICQRRTGACVMLQRTGFFLFLFPVSACFWWFFEYLNRFVQNWFYTGVHFPPLKYFILATFSFATVLPAVLSMQQLLLSFDWIRLGFASFCPVSCSHPKPAAEAALFLSGLGLALLAVWPNYLFPLLWVSPLLIIVSLQVLWNESGFGSSLAVGNWRGIVSFSMAALVCGFFWEMWNFYSLAKWEYSVPFVQRFPIFEMPLLGYAGYLPFGLECSVIVALFDKVAGQHYFKGKWNF
jgi:hypothetical protein